MRGRFFEENWSRVLELQNFVSKHQYFSGDCLPGIADALMFQIFDQEFPDKHTYPFVYYWFINLKQFSPVAISNWKNHSKNDFYFLSLLKRYQRCTNCDSECRSFSNSSKSIQKVGFSPERKQKESSIYVLEMRLKQPAKGVRAELRKHIKEKSKVISFEETAGLTRIKLRCDLLNIELIKGELRQSKDIRCYEIKKEKQKIARAQTFATS